MKQYYSKPGLDEYQYVDDEIDCFEAQHAFFCKYNCKYIVQSIYRGPLKRQEYLVLYHWLSMKCQVLGEISTFYLFSE